jgi:hypothetical protein
MSTRSLIIVQHPYDGLKPSKYETIYCHSDGYPSHNGLILEGSYKEHKFSLELVSLGNLSKLRSKIHASGVHNFDDPEFGVCVFYGRDRGETGNESSLSDNLIGFFMSKSLEITAQDYHYFYIDLHCIDEFKWYYIDYDRMIRQKRSGVLLKDCGLKLCSTIGI